MAGPRNTHAVPRARHRQLRRGAPALVLVLLVLAFVGRDVVGAPAGNATNRVVTISRAIDPTGSRDVSFEMAAFVASVPDGSTIELATDGRYWMDQTLVLYERHNLVIEGNNSMFFTVTPGGRRRSNVRIMNSSGIVIDELSLRGANPNGGLSTDAYDPVQEHQHGFELLSVTNLTLENVTVTDVYGDFVYLSQMPGGSPSTGVLIADSAFARNGRQGIALISARDVNIQRNTIDDVRMATFDFEPGVGQTVDDVTVSRNNVGSGRQLFVAANGEGSVDHITVASNLLDGQALQIWAGSPTSGLRDAWTIVANTSDLVFGSTNGVLMQITGGNGVKISANTQPFDPNRTMVMADIVDSCNVAVHDNSIPGSVAEVLVVGTC